MQISSRSRTYYVFLLSGLVLAGVTVWIAWKTGFFEPGKSPGGLFSEKYNALFLSGVVSAVSSCCIGLMLSAYFVLRMRKTTSFELFFFSAAAFSLVFELFRIVAFSFYFDRSYILFIDTITRVLIGARFFGIVCLFMGSLYSCGFMQGSVIKYLTGLILLSVFFSVLQPVNSGTLDSSFLSSIGNARNYYIFTIFISIVTVVNYMIAGRNDPVFIRSGFFLAGFIVSRQVLQYASGLVQVILAAIACIVCALLYIRTLFTQYMWD